MSYMRLKDVPKVEDFLRSSATVPSRATIEYVRENDAYVVSRGKDWLFPPVTYQVSANHPCLLDGNRQPLNPLDGFADVRLDQMMRENGACINDPQHWYLLATVSESSLVLQSDPQHASTLLLVQRQTAQQVRDWKWPTTGYLDIAERPFQGLYMTVCALYCTQEMRNLIREVLSEREANYNAEAVAVSAMLRSRYQELQQLADELNLRLNAVRQVKGFSGVWALAVYERFEEGEYDLCTQGGSGRRFMAAENAVAYVSNLEIRSAAYQEYSRLFAQLNHKLNQAHGWISTLDTNYAEMKIPRHVVGAEESTICVRRLSYTAQDYVAAREIVEDELKREQEAMAKIAKYQAE